MYKRFYRILIVFNCCIAAAYGYTQNAKPPGKAERILFLGNSITYAGTYIINIESYYKIHYPKNKYQFINAGLPSETVSGLSEEGHAGGKFPRPDLHERLGRVLALVKPDIVFASYGMNDGIYLPLHEGRFKAFRDGMHWLHDTLVKAGVKRIVHVTPPVHDDKTAGLNGYNNVLDIYSSWLLAQRDSLQWEVADVHFPMKDYLLQKRLAEPGFKLANDGVHPGAAGHWLIAKAILGYLGEPVGTAPDIETALGTGTYSSDVLRQVTQRQQIMKDAWLTASGHKRPGMAAGLPLDQALQLYGRMENLIRQSATASGPQRIRIACVGNSITAGARLAIPATQSYPAQLQELLGNGYDVMNFGVSSKTAMNTGDNSYMKTTAYQDALNSRPDIVAIKLGANDSRLPYRLQIADSFLADYRSIIHAFQHLPTKPRIILMLPLASYLTDTAMQWNEVIVKQIMPRMRQLAFEEKLELMDLHAITLEKAALFPDKLHPDSTGAALVAQRLFEAITQKTATGFDLFAALPAERNISAFYGYDCAAFKFEGHDARVVKPRVVASGKPWVWRARFWGHEPQTDIALLDRGYHIVYCDVVELYGNDEAVDRWNKFYAMLHGAGLSKKAVLEGMSRGGVYMYNWAARNPDKVACVYADAPVLDLRSWPGGKGRSKGSTDEWEKFKKDYGYNTEAETAAFKNSPLDQVAAIVKGGYPMLHVVGDLDIDVPVDEHTALFEKQVKALGGNITVIHKPAVAHHPHSLPNPQPIVDFIVKAVAKN